MVKEDLRTLDGKKVFPPRFAETAKYSLSPPEHALYLAVTDYVRNEVNRVKRMEQDAASFTQAETTRSTTCTCLILKRLAQSPNRMVVISVSLSGKELQDFDHLVEHFGYDSRSSAVRDALHQYVAQHRFQFKEGNVDAVLTLVYNAGSSQEKVRDFIHEHEDLVRTNFHNHMGAQCADVLVLHGKGRPVHEFVDGLTRLRNVRVSVSVVGGEGSHAHDHAKT